MKCLICGKNYINLGVHVKKKHMPCNEYKIKFNIPLSVALADKALCDSLSISAKQRLEDPEWLEACTKRCSENKGSRNKVKLPDISKKHLITMNKEKGESYRARMIPTIMDDYMGGLTPIEIRRKHGVSPATLQDWVKRELLPKRKLKYCFE